MICIFGALLTVELYRNVKSRMNSQSVNTRWKDAQLVIVCVCSIAVPASRLYIYLASVERQRFLIRDGIQTLVFSVGPKQRSLQLL